MAAEAMMEHPSPDYRGVCPRIGATVLTHPTEGSILRGAGGQDFHAFFVAGRQRYATCSGVAWFRGYHLAVVNLLGRHLRIYELHPSENDSKSQARLALVHELRDGMEGPESVAVSPDASLLAVTHSNSEQFGVSVFCLDPNDPIPMVGTRRNVRAGLGLNRGFHGLAFSPDSRFLAFTEISHPGFVEVLRVDLPDYESTCWLTIDRGGLMPKSVAFSRDGRFAAIIMGFVGTPFYRAISSGGRVLIHQFDSANGVIEPEPLAELACAGTDLASLEPLRTRCCARSGRQCGAAG
jgi:hypothetical protein